MAFAPAHVTARRTVHFLQHHYSLRPLPPRLLSPLLLSLSAGGRRFDDFFDLAAFKDVLGCRLE